MSSVVCYVLNCRLQCRQSVFRTQRISRFIGREIRRWLRLLLRGFERVQPLFHLNHRGAQRRRLLQIGFGLLQRGLKLRQRRRQGSRLHHDLNGRQLLGVDFGQHRVIDGQRAERRIARRRHGGKKDIASGVAGMKIPAGVFLDTIDDVLLVHHQVIVRINVTPDVIGADDFGIANGGIIRRWRRWLRLQRELGRGRARGEEHQGNEIEWFHGFGVVAGCSSVSSAKPAPPNEASARSMVCRT